MNNYNIYKALDFFVRSEDRIFNLNRSRLSPIVKEIIECNFDTKLDDNTKAIVTDDIIIVGTDKLIAKDYILYNSKETVLLLLPEMIRSDEMSVENKIKYIFDLSKCMIDRSFKKDNSIYSLQIELMPLFTVCAILFRMYEPYEDLCKTICNTILSSLSDDDRKEVLSVMDYIYNNMDDSFLEKLFNYGFMNSIINKDLATKIINSYTS